MLYEGEEPEDYPEEMEQQHDSDYGGDDDQGFYEGGVGVEPSFTMRLDRRPRDTDFKSPPLRPFGHRQPKLLPPARSTLYHQATDEGIEQTREKKKGRLFGDNAWTDYGSF